MYLQECDYREADKEQYSKYVRNHHPAIVSAEVWEAAQLRFKGNSEKHNTNVSDVAEQEEDGLAMAEDWCGPKEIAGMLDIVGLW